MHDDPSFYAFAPGWAEPAQQPTRSGHERHHSLLELSKEDKAEAESLTVPELPKREPVGPPKATVARRAQSYSDFHYAVTTFLKQEEQSKAKKGKDKEQSKANEGQDKDLRHGRSKRWSVSEQWQKERTNSLQEASEHVETEEIEDDLEFAAWYEGLESELIEASHDEYKSYLDELRFTETYLDAVSSSTAATLDLLSTLQGSFNDVDSQTTAFQEQCQNLIREQSRLETLEGGISENIQYYSYLEPITRKLNAPGAGNYVRGKEFSDMLARLDECLDYMANHMSQREAPTYRSRYRLLLTRGLTLIRVNFVGALRDIAADVSKRIADKQLNETTMSALLYAKFRVGASELKTLALEIRKRAVVPVDAEPGAEAEYQSLMNELYNGYSATRGKLILPLIHKKISEIALASSGSGDLLSFARSSIGYIRGICDDEHGLWREWFEDEIGLYDFLEVVCEPLYDHLRPRIIHETQLVKLCELCTLLQTRYFQDDEANGDEPDEYEQQQRPTHQLDFATLIQPALEDAQTRLVFRAQAILRDEIENFKPKREDIDYPARNKATALSGTKNGPATSGRRQQSIPELPRRDSAAAAANGDDGILNVHYDFDVEKSFQNWYPTLRKAIWLLSRIYRLVNSQVFDDLAHQIVHQTTFSLQRASTQIRANSKDPFDAQLFLLKHLLLLKQQIVAFDIEFSSQDVTFDFSGMANTFWELRQRGSIFDPRTLWRAVTGTGIPAQNTAEVTSPGGTAGGGMSSLLPRVVENMLDAKAELDGVLRACINDFVSAAAARITAPLSKTGNNSTSKSPPSGEVIHQIQKATETELPALRSRLESYLGDARTRETLVQAVLEQVVASYETWFDNWSESQKKGKHAAGAKSKKDEPWDAGAFADWAASAFRVGKAYAPSARKSASRRLSGGSGGSTSASVALSSGGSGSGGSST